MNKYGLFNLIMCAAVCTAVAQTSVRLDITAGSAALKGQALAAILVTDVKDLDTYSFDVVYDTAAWTVRYAGIDAPAMNVTNCIKDMGGSLLPVIKKDPGTVHISATVPGSDPIGTIKGPCALGVLLFAPRIASPVSPFILTNVTLLDTGRNRISVIVRNPAPVQDGK